MAAKTATKMRTTGRKVPPFMLRTHPAVHWPPGVEPNAPWAGPGAAFPDPSRVTLTNVEMVAADKHAGRHLTLTGTCNGDVYRTTLTTEDPALLVNLCELLAECCGHTIGAIGARRVNRALKPV